MKTQSIYISGVLILLSLGIAHASDQAPQEKKLTGKERRYFSLGQTQLAQKFLACSPEAIAMRDEHGWDPLMISAVAGQEKIVAHILTLKNLDINTRDKNGVSVLMHVVTNPHSFSMVKRLVKAGVPIAGARDVLAKRMKDSDHEGYKKIDAFLKNPDCFAE